MPLWRPNRHSALFGIGANDHHNQSHDHSAAGDGTALAPATLTLGGTDITAAWTSFSSTLTTDGAGADPNLGSTGSFVGNGIRLGKRFDGRGLFQFAGTGVSAGSGEYRWSLPVTAAGPAGTIVGLGYLWDSSATLLRDILLDAITSTSGRFILGNAAAGAAMVTHANPFTFAVNDFITFNLSYEGT